jgi:uncharacterized damage-inducible protein DinB
MTPAHLHNLANYNRWANARLFEASAALTAEERERDLRASFNSLEGTLIHILWGARMARLLADRKLRAPASTR